MLLEVDSDHVGFGTIRVGVTDHEEDFSNGTVSSIVSRGYANTHG